MNIKTALAERILLLDGALGTYYNELYPEKGEAEIAGLKFPDEIFGIHAEYIRAGADLIRTNTFAVNHLLFPDKNKRDEALESAVRIAKKAADEIRSVGILGSIGPIRQDADVDRYDIEEYSEIAEVLIGAGVDGILLETFSDMSEVKQIVSSIRAKHPDVFIMASYALNVSGYTNMGYSAQSLFNDCEYLDAVGLNCGIGSAHMERVLKSVELPKGIPVAVYPNAGYQLSLRGRRQNPDQASYFVEHLGRILKQGIRIAGGCCGTTPEHIRLLRKETDRTINDEAVDGSIPVQKKILNVSSAEEIKRSENRFYQKLQSGEKVFVVELDSPFKSNREGFEQMVKKIKDEADIITISDSPMAKPRADSGIMASIMHREHGVEVMPHICCRDKNIIGIRAELLALHMADIRNLLIITGDPVNKEDRQTISGVFDFNSVRLMNYIKQLNSDLLKDDPFIYGGALNYDGVGVQSIIERMKNKMNEGCSYFLTQPIYSNEDIERVKMLRETTGAKVICGIMPLVSYRNALFMKNEVHGINVPDEIMNLYDPEMTREEGESVALSMAVDLAKKLEDIADGYYLMTPLGRVDLIRRILTKIK